MHHSNFSAVKKNTIGTFISVSGKHEKGRLEHLSQSTRTHTVHSMELWSARQSLLQTYVPSKRTGGWVCHPSCSLHPSLHDCYLILKGSHIQRQSWTHTHTANCWLWTALGEPLRTGRVVQKSTAGHWSIHSHINALIQQNIQCYGHLLCLKEGVTLYFWKHLSI